MRTLVLHVLTTGLIGTLLAPQTASAQDIPDLLLAFDLQQNANIDEKVPYTKTNALHNGLRLVSGLKLGAIQPQRNEPGFEPHNSTIGWAFIGLGSGTRAGDDTEATTLERVIQNDLYISFTVAPAPGRVLNLSNGTLMVSFNYMSGGKTVGPSNSALLTSLTGFSADQVLSQSTSLDRAVATYTLSHPTLAHITDPIEIRLYFWREDGDATDAAGLSVLQFSGIPGAHGGNVVLTGDVIDAP